MHSSWACSLSSSISTEPCTLYKLAANRVHFAKILCFNPTKSILWQSIFLDCVDTFFRVEIAIYLWNRFVDAWIQADEMHATCSKSLLFHSMLDFEWKFSNTSSSKPTKPKWSFIQILDFIGQKANFMWLSKGTLANLTSQILTTISMWNILFLLWMNSVQ